MTRLILYNIEYCEGTTRSFWQYLDIYHLFRSRKNLDMKIIDFLKSYDPDILALIEVDGVGFRSRRVDDVALFGKYLDFEYLVGVVKYGFRGVWNKLPVLRHQENALLSKFEFEEVDYHFFKKGTKRVVIEAKVDVGGLVTIFVVHLALFKKTRRKQIYELVDLVNKTSGPLLVVGDFNTFKQEELDILLFNTRLVDAYSFNKSKFKFTGPSWKPKYRLDNILVTEDVLVSNYEILDVHFSDHLPVLVDFELKKK